MPKVTAEKIEGEVKRFVWKTIVVVVGVTVALMLMCFVDIPADKVRLWAGLPICGLSK